MNDPQREANGHVNEAMDMDMDDDFSTPKSNNNRKIGLPVDEKKNPEKQQHHQPAVVFEDLPYEPNFVMDKIENFWALIEQFFEKNDRTFKIFGRVILAVLYNVYFFGAVAYYIQYKVKS
jgi:hypothetical protein